MLRKAATMAMTFIVGSFLIIGITLYTSCDKASPTIPCNCGDDRDPIGSSDGTVGDDVEMQQDYFSIPESGDMVAEVTFADDSGNKIGSAQLTAVHDVVAHVSLQQFNVPGETFIDMGGYFTLKVVITSSQSNPLKYKVVITNLETSESITFYIDKITTLAKSSAAGETADEGYNDTQLTAGIATNSVLLCIGAYDAVDESRVCEDSAEPYCGSRIVEDVYLEARFSLENGCESGCKVICKTHDQGVFGS